MLEEESKCRELESYDKIYTQTITSDNFDDMSTNFMKLLEKYKLVHRKSMYYLFVESVQNVLRHGLIQAHEQPVFHFMKKKSKEKFLLIAGNPIEQDEKETITNKIDIINKLSKETIDQVYFHLMESDFFTKGGGGGLGFLEMRRKSNYRRIKYHIKEYENCYYFYLILEYHAF